MHMTEDELRAECAQWIAQSENCESFEEWAAQSEGTDCFEERVVSLMAFVKRQQAVGLREVEKMCDETARYIEVCAGDAKSDYGIGYQNAMKEISVHCEVKAKEREG
jgi:hypothetical protein